MEKNSIDIVNFEFKARCLIDRELINLGFRYSFKGTRYIADIMLFTLRHGENYLLEPCCKVIYPEVAKLRAVSWRAVERNIRYAIGEAWLHGNIEKLWKIFPRCAENDSRPSNMEFLQRFSRLALFKVHKELCSDFTISRK